MYISAESSQTFIYTPKMKNQIKSSVKKLELSLPPFFLRVHKSHIVNIYHINFINSQFVECNIGESIIPIGSTFKKLIRRRIIIYS